MKIKKTVIIIMFVALIVFFVCRIFGIGEIVLASALGQVPFIGTLCTFADCISLFKLQKELSMSQHPWVTLEMFIQVLASIYLAYKAGEYSKGLGPFYSVAVGFCVCCFGNILAGYMISQFVDMYQGLFLEIENRFNELSDFKGNQSF